MAAKFRNLIASNTLGTLRSLKVVDTPETIRELAAKCRLQNNKSRISFNLDTRSIPHFSKNVMTDFIKKYPEDGGVTGIAASESHISFYLDNSSFIQQVLRTTATRPKEYKWSRNALFEEKTKHVFVEFSSPNIAKPFHIGHFRSAIIGNFVANIHQAIGHTVLKVNYLGDWGTQFGYLIAGIEHFNVDLDELKEGSLKKILDIYVEANQLGETDEQFNKKARDMFARLENGDEQLMQTWRFFKDISIKELENIYSRLGIEFDEYHGESMYARDKSNHILDLLNKNNLLEDLNGCKVLRLKNGRTVTIVKSDGSSLYITRDIAAIINRFEAYSIDNLIYVVDNDQSSHFKNLFEIAEKLGSQGSNRSSHVRFGKILGISTRKGNMIFLDTIIDEAKARMLENQEKSKTTRAFGEEAHSAANTLGISALVINDFKQRRARDYNFSWENALNPNGDTGVRLQYLHARLTSLVENCGVSLDLDCPTQTLTEKEAVDLAFHIGCWDEVLSTSYQELEPAVIVKYLFKLANLTNRCMKCLTVKGQDEEVARARLLLFYCSKQILVEAFKILAIKPIDRM